MKRIIYCLLSVLAGIVIAAGSAFAPIQKELIHFIGCMFITGGFIFLNGIWKGDPFGKYMIRLGIYFALGILLVLVPLKMNMAEVMVRIAKGVGEAAMITSLWEFFSYTTLKREE